MNRYNKVKYNNKTWLVLRVYDEDNTVSIRDEEGNERRIHIDKVEKI